MADDSPFYAPNRAPAPAREPKPGELLFEFHVERTKTFYRVELHDHGCTASRRSSFDPIDPVIARTFRADLDPTQTPREMAIAWAEEERRALEAGQ